VEWILLNDSSPSSLWDWRGFFLWGYPMVDRVMIFIDYQNVHGWARRRFHPPDTHPSIGHIDPVKLAELLVARRRRSSRLEDVRVYRGRPGPDFQPAAAAANDRQAAEWVRHPAVTVVRHRPDAGTRDGLRLAARACRGRGLEGGQPAQFLGCPSAVVPLST
jgi:hypothetical protein